MKVLLGCGNRPMAGWLNCDLTAHKGIDKAFDLRVTPWPLPSGKAEEIRAEDVLEHLTEAEGLAFMDECWRILAPGGTLWLQVPEWGSRYHQADFTHCRGFCLESFDLFDPDQPSGIAKNNFYTTRLWRILSKVRPKPKQPLSEGRNLVFVLEKRES